MHSLHLVESFSRHSPRHGVPRGLANPGSPPKPLIASGTTDRGPVPGTFAPLIVKPPSNGCWPKDPGWPWQDTTSLDFTHPPATRELGYLGHPRHRGLWLHSVLCVSRCGGSLGLMHQQVWTRPLSELGKRRAPQSDPNARQREPMLADRACRPRSTPAGRPDLEHGGRARSRFLRLVGGAAPAELAPGDSCPSAAQGAARVGPAGACPASAGRGGRAGSQQARASCACRAGPSRPNACTARRRRRARITRCKLGRHGGTNKSSNRLRERPASSRSGKPASIERGLQARSASIGSLLSCVEVWPGAPFPQFGQGPGPDLLVHKAQGNPRGLLTHKTE